MDVRCEKCSTEYEFDEERVGQNGVTVKCTACGYVFKVRRPKRPAIPRSTTTLGAGPQGREWLVRKPDGQMIAFRELTTLQKWIVEGRITRDDEISKNGETWKRLGNILELEPFFSVFEKARALNDLIERGALEGQQVQIRGSEVLATMNPLTSLPLESQAPKSGAIARAVTVGVDPPSKAEVAAAAAVVVRPSTHPSGSASAAPAPTIALPGPSLPPQLPRPASGAHPPARPISTESKNGNGHSSRDRPLDAPPPLPRAAEASARPAARPTSKPSARPVERTASTPPARASSKSKGWELTVDEDHDPSKVVAQFQRGERTRKALVTVGALVVLGAAGGVLVAKYGPAGNPVQVFAERFGLLQPKVVDDGAGLLLEEAQRAVDQDTLDSLEKADALYEKAMGIRPADRALAAERALVVVVRADALRRAAADLEALALETERARAEHELRVKEAAEKKEPPPAAPSLADPAALRQEAQEKLALASKLLNERGFELASASYSPESLEHVRALAEYYRVQRDLTRYTREVGLAKAALEARKATDPALLYTEAAAARSLLSPPNDDQALALVEQALSIRPSLSRARVLRARILLARRQPDRAEQELARVLESAPAHQEAARLKLIAARAAQELAVDAQRAAEPAKPAAEPTPAPAPATPEEDPKKAAAKSFEGLLQQGDRLRERDRPKAALGAYEKAGELRPTSAEPWSGMGWAYIDLDKPQAALNMFRKAMRANDRYAEAFYGLAEAHRLLGEKEQAIEWYEKYLARGPAGPDRKAAERALEELRK